MNVFFVLSGLVLALPFLGSAPPRAIPFVVKRIIRIYVPYFVVMTAAAVIMEVLLPLGQPHESTWFAQYWNRHATVLTIFNYIFMFGLKAENYINPVMWSLIHELRISLIFPFLAYLVNVRKPVELLTTFFIVSCAAKFALHFAGMDHWWSSLLDTCQYLFFFVAGAEMARYRAQISGIYVKASPATRLGICVAALLLLNAKWELPQIYTEISFLCGWTGAIAIVALTLASAGHTKILRWTPFLWLGQISYSLYLTHCLVLIASLFVFRSIVPPLLIVVWVPVVSLCVAVLVYRTIELPATLLARRLISTNSFEGRASQATRVWM